MEIWVKTRKAFCQNWIKDIMPVIIQFFIAILKLQTDTGNHKDTVKICLLICIKIGLSRIYTRQDVSLVWTRRDFLYVAGKSKFLVEHFLMGILLRSWSFCIRSWTRNAKLPRLIRFISFKIWHRYAICTQKYNQKCNQLLNFPLQTISHFWFISWRRLDAYRLGLTT